MDSVGVPPGSGSGVNTHVFPSPVPRKRPPESVATQSVPERSNRSRKMRPSARTPWAGPNLTVCPVAGSHRRTHAEPAM